MKPAAVLSLCSFLTYAYTELARSISYPSSQINVVASDQQQWERKDERNHDY